MLGENGESSLIALVMLLRRGWPMDLFIGVVDFQRKDGKPVDDEARSLRVERSVGVLLPCELEQKLVDLLDQVVALLIQAVDGVLDLRNAGVGGVRTAGGVFFVPEVEVGQVLRPDERDEVGGRRFGGVVAVPEHVGFVVEAENGGCVELRSVAWSGLRLKCGHGDKGSKDQKSRFGWNP